MIKVKNGFLFFAGIAMLVWLARAGARRPEVEMDNEPMPPHSAPPESEAAQANPESAAPLDAGAVVEQVRELLFGEKQRSNEQQHRDIEASIESLRRDMLERFAMLESRVADLDREVEARHASTIDGIGLALADLGAHVRKLAEPRRGK